MKTPAAVIRKLINLTHKHGVQDKNQVRVLQKRIKALEALNDRRRKELAAKVPPSHFSGAFTMYDSTQIDQIPRGAKAVACYVNGDFANLGEASERFPHAMIVTLSVKADGDADGLDVEHGDAEPADCPEWVRRQQARGIHRPILYGSLSTMQEIFKALARKGVTRNDVLLWVAQPTGVPHIPPGYDACQYEWHGNYDVSLCEPHFVP